ncbi:MAG: Fe-S-cluster-containing hydrogenase [Bacteroidales bacterium]|nr:Fe-S-cluster-containing hydrogenase [Bacteroidales bacterium]
MEKKYWKSLEERNGSQVENPGRNDEDASKSLLEIINEEIAEKPSSRRNFLKFAGFSFATAAIATSCKNPVNTAIPLLNKPEEVTPGMANYYASTYFDGQDYNSILVKVRDGRPIKIEGNELSSFNGGATSARVQGSVLSLYDDGGRIKAPLISGQETTWNMIDQAISSKLASTAASGKQIVILSSTIASPSTLQVIKDFTVKYPTTRLVMYDPASVSAILQANEESMGLKVVPDYHIERADLIVSFSADFLGTWLSPVEFNRRWAETRRLTEEKTTISKLHVYESSMSLTGANADIRVPVKPSQQANIILNLYNEVAMLSGRNTYPAPASVVNVKQLAHDLVEAKGRSLVISGINDPAIQIIINAINALLDNYGTTIDLGTSLNIRKGDDRVAESLIQDMKTGNVGAILLYNCNPVYDYPGNTFKESLRSVPLSVSFASASNETSVLCNYVCPDHHFLESWNDAEPKNGKFSLQQPTIRNIFNTRQAQDSLLKWSGSTSDYYTTIRNYWQSNLYSRQNTYSQFNDFWNHSLQDGVFELSDTEWSAPAFVVSSLDLAAEKSAIVPGKSEIELEFYETIALGAGQHANNPWLMEMPDPVSKVCWDNFASVSPKLAEKLGIVNGDVLYFEKEKLEIPAFIQPGQAEGTIGIAYGYGRRDTGKVADNIGINVFPLMMFSGGSRTYSLHAGEFRSIGNNYKLATTQMHHSMEGRPIVRETTLEEWQKKPDAGNELHTIHQAQNKTLYKDFEFGGHHWGMAIDLNACTGCSSCVIACQAENNVAVVGKEQVAMTRIMHWIRIDRYYSEDPENPSVYFQPIMCQHCDNAPCENVCPVSATNHSNEGLNQMAYNRCIGTKYCINNCPYKVRRFNWFRYATNDAFNYNQNSDLGRMVLNPDVTVRERGVVEKCSFCVQRIQEKKLLAKLEGRKLTDGEIMPACAQACPSKAVVFGDLNDPESQVSKLFTNQRNYHLLEEIHTLPKVGYLTKVRNRGKSGESATEHHA